MDDINTKAGVQIPFPPPVNVSDEKLDKIIDLLERLHEQLNPDYVYENGTKYDPSKTRD